MTPLWTVKYFHFKDEDTEAQRNEAKTQTPHSLSLAGLGCHPRSCDSGSQTFLSALKGDYVYGISDVRRHKSPISSFGVLWLCLFYVKFHAINVFVFAIQKKNTQTPIYH